MSTFLKMVLHVQKTLKKKLPKTRKRARKISVVELHYSQTIFLIFQFRWFLKISLVVFWFGLPVQR